MRRHAAVVLGHTGAEDVDPESGFRELGFSSVTAVELAAKLGAAVGLKLPSTFAFDYPNASAAADHLDGLLAADTADGRGGNPAGDPAEAEIRQALQSIPLARMRDAGLLDGLLELAGMRPDPAVDLDRDLDLDLGTVQDEDDLDSLDSLDAEALVNLVLRDTDS